MIFQTHNHFHRLKAVLGFLKFKVWTKLHFRESDNFGYVYLNITQEELLDRYLLNLLQQLNSTSPTIIVIPLRVRFLCRFFEGRNWRPYATMLIQSHALKFTRISTKRDWKEVSWDYFQGSHQHANSIRVPIGPHPVHFDRFKNVSKTKRRNSIFFSGAQSEEYSSCFLKGDWGMPSRIESINFLKMSGLGAIVTERMTPEEYQEKLKIHRYFLAFPGMHMPLCHNIFEAIFSGCIPISHSNYLNLLPIEIHEPLAPFSWNTHSELINLIHRLTEGNDAGNDEEKAVIALQSYTHSYFHSSKLTDSLSRSKTILICGEEYSLQHRNVTMS